MAFFVALLGYIIATKSVSMHQWCRALAGEWHFWRQVVIRWLRSRGVWCDERARASLSSPRHRCHYNASQDGRRVATFCALNHRSPRHCRGNNFFTSRWSAWLITQQSSAPLYWVLCCLQQSTLSHRGVCCRVWCGYCHLAWHIVWRAMCVYQWRHTPLRAYSSMGRRWWWRYLLCYDERVAYFTVCIHHESQCLLHHAFFSYVKEFPQ